MLIVTIGVPYGERFENAPWWFYVYAAFLLLFLLAPNFFPTVLRRGRVAIEPAIISFYFGRQEEQPLVIAKEEIRSYYIPIVNHFSKTNSKCFFALLDGRMIEFYCDRTSIKNRHGFRVSRIVDVAIKQQQDFEVT